MKNEMNTMEKQTINANFQQAKNKRIHKNKTIIVITQQLALSCDKDLFQLFFQLLKISFKWFKVLSIIINYGINYKYKEEKSGESNYKIEILLNKTYE